MSIAAKISNGIINSKFMTCLTKPNAPTAAATVASLSCITKDAVNCYYYVTQSLHNEKIPEEKRKFVAGLDLSNGILNVVMQSLMTKLVINNKDKIFDACFGKHFTDEHIAELYRANKDILKMPFELFSKHTNNFKNLAKTGFAVFTTLAVTQILTKRIIVPLIATPMASFFKERFEKKSQGQNKQVPMNPQITRNVDCPKRNNNLPSCYKDFIK